MPDTKISAAPAAAAALSTHELGVNEAGTSKKVTLLQIFNYITGALATVTFSGHLVSTQAGTPQTSALGANVTSATFTGNDVRGKIVVVMSGGLAANTKVATCTYFATYGGTVHPLLIDQTSGVGLAVVNSYSANDAAGSFDLFFDQALVAGTYTIDYIVIG